MKISYYPGCTLKTKAKDLDRYARASAGVLGVEMEAAALYMNAARAGKKALAVLSVSDSFVHKEENLSGDEREKSFTDMMKVALEIA